MQSLISIIIPVYNVEKYLTRCFDSILEQTYQNWEALIINDGSTDNSLEICNSYAKKDERFKVFSQENQGVSAARNHGLDRVSGEYICFVDADDYISQIYIETLVYNMISTKADISICGYRCSGEFEKDIDLPVQVWTQEETIRQWFQYKSIAGCVWGELYKWKSVSELRFDCNYRLGEDQIYFFEALKRGNRVAYQDVKLYFYFERSNSAMNRPFDERYWDCVHMAEYFQKEGWKNFSSQIDLFTKKEIFTYIVLAINASKVRNALGKEMLKTVLPRIKKSTFSQIVKYCSNYEKLKYVLFKYIPKVACFGIYFKKIFNG